MLHSLTPPVISKHQEYQEKQREFSSESRGKLNRNVAQSIKSTRNPLWKYRFFEITAFVTNLWWQDGQKKGGFA